MKKLRIRKWTVAILFVAALDIAIGCLFFTNRAFPRLVLWPIRESADIQDFMWEPEHKPAGFYFEKESPLLLPFKNDIITFIQDVNSDFSKDLAIASYAHSLNSRPAMPAQRLKWGSPEELAGQLKAGYIGNCFHYSIVYCAYLAGAGIPCRLWALEGDDGLGPLTHTICEAYFAKDKQWAIIDGFWGVYFLRNDKPLSVFELRDALLAKAYSGITVESVNGGPVESEEILRAYTRLMPDIFLRTGNDFAERYESGKRYGILSPFSASLDRLPSEWRRGISYLSGRQDFLIHFVDEFSNSLKYKVMTARIIFYFFILSITVLTIILLIIFWRFP